MTDKQMEEKKKEFYKRFPSIYQGLDTGGYVTIDAEVWQWIVELVEEVERESHSSGYVSAIKRRDVERRRESERRLKEETERDLKLLRSASTN